MKKLAIVLLCCMLVSVGVYAYTNISSATTITSKTTKLLPLGDGKTSPSPKVGYIFTCGSHIDQNGGGAGTDGPRIQGSYRDPSKKISVTGAIIRKEASFSVISSGKNIVLMGNGLPLRYPTGVFPVGRTDPAYTYDRNPNTISKQTILLSIPKNPVIASTPTCIGGGPIGYALNGVAIFDGLDALARDAVAHEVQDSCSGHPEKTGQYHYHSMSKCFKDTTKVNQHSSQIGYAIDGFGIYGSKGDSGHVLVNTDLDTCHGHMGKIMWNGKVVTMYHYHATAEYPYTIGCFKGTPTKQTMGQGTQTQQGQIQQGQNTPPAGPLQACGGKKAGATCTFVGMGGETVSDTCRQLQDGNMVCGGPK